MIYRRILFYFICFFSTASLWAQVADFTTDKSSGCSPLIVNFTNTSTGSTSWTWNFGNTNNSSAQNPSASYSAPGTYTVTLTASNGGSSTTKTATITVYPDPVADFSFTPTVSCPNKVITFNDLSTSGAAIVSRNWGFGDGNSTSGNSATVTHSYIITGTFPVTVLVVDANGCDANITKNVTISPAPTANFTSSITAACAPPLTVNFTNTSTGAGSPTYSWSFGDGNTATTQNPSNTYNTNGLYNVKLVVTAGACKDSITKNSLVNIQPIVADFTANTFTVCSGSAVNFTDASTGGVTNWAWNFGDGGTGTAQNPSYTYNTPGTYNVTLTASNAFCSDVEIKNAYITVLPSPTANWTTSTPTTACTPPLTVNFTDASTGTITNWLWLFGDGNTSTSASPSHTYTTAGAFAVQLTVTASNGCTNTKSVGSQVVIAPPVANFTANRILDCAPSPIAFTFTGSSPVDPITTYNWDYGDGNIVNNAGANPSHIYTAVGVYSVTVTIITASGCTATLTRNAYITIIDLFPVPDFNATNTTTCYNPGVKFNNTTVNGISYVWNFGDGGSSSQTDPTHQYPVGSGTYTVTLTAMNGAGCMSTVTKPVSVTIHPPDVTNFTVAADCNVPFKIDFSSVGPYTGVDNIEWLFGDGNSNYGNSQTISHTYAATGTYTVRMIFHNTTFGCSDTVSSVVNVWNPSVDFTATPLLGCAPLTTNFTATGQDIANYNWSFGDATTSGTITSNTTSHAYNSTGIYTVTLTATAFSGCTYTVTKADYVTVGGSVITLGVDKQNGCNPLTVNFTQSGTSTTPITSYIWDFGDGSPTQTLGTNAAPSHTYTTVGTYTPTVTWVDGSGCSRTQALPSPINITRPIVGYTAQADICRGSIVNFVGAGVSGVAPLTREWIFGDGQTQNTGTTNNTTHAYFTAGGNVTSKLIVTDGNGCKDSATRVVNVIRPLANINFSLADYNCGYAKIDFSDASVTSTGIVKWDWNFGNGSTSDLQNPTVFYTQSGIYNIKLIVEDVDGCKDTIVADSLINVPGPFGDYTFAPSSGCGPLTVKFDANVGNTQTFFWDFGDGESFLGTNDTISHTYFVGVNAFPNLILQTTLPNGATCSVTATNLTGKVIVSPAISAVAVIDTFACPGAPLNFNVTTSSNAIKPTFAWTFGDGNSATTASSTNSYASPGLYTVKIAVTDSFGCIDSIKRNVLIQRPIVDFNDSILFIGCGAGEIKFKDASYSQINGWKWDFGDGNSSTSQNPTHNYTTAGTYNVELVATNIKGCSDSLVKNALVTITASPSGSFTFGPVSGCGNTNVTFTASTNSAQLYQWDFGDGTKVNTSTGSVSHTYLAGTSGTPTLIIKSVQANGDTCVVNATNGSGLFTTGVVPGVTLLADTFICPGSTAAFNITSSGTNPSYSWNFGDANTATTTGSTSHTYPNPGSYTITTVVTDSSGCQTTLTRNLLVQKPTVVFNDSLLIQGCGATTIKFTDSSYSYINAWKWDLGDGQTQNSKSFTYTYTTPGTYSVKLLVTNIAGCSDSITKTNIVTVVAQPTGSFTFTPAAGCVPLTVNFKSNSPGATSYAWDFGDGSSTTTTTDAASHTYLTSGTYTPTLTVSIITGGISCSFIAQNNTGAVTVYPQVTVDILPTTVTIFDGAYEYVTPTTNIPGAHVSLWTPTVGVDCPSCLNTLIFDINKDTTYYLTVTDTANGGCSATDSLRVLYKPCEYDFKIPNVFSPNNDGANEIFKPVNLCPGFENYKMIIYSRWGNLIFESDAAKAGWDGKTTTNVDAPDGTYYYIITVKDRTFTGFVTLVR